MPIPTAPRERPHPCKLCGKPDYLAGLCWRHYKAARHIRICSICQNDRQIGDAWDERYDAHVDCAAEMEWQRIEDVRDRENWMTNRG